MTYPTALTIAQGTSGTALNTTNYNVFVDNINAIIVDLINARADNEAGMDHSSGTVTTISGMLSSMRHVLMDLVGGADWYTEPVGSLKAHTHAVGQGGLVPWSSLGASNARKVELHPQYPGGLQTNSLRGASASGSNTITITNIQDVVSYVARHCYNGVSASVSLNDTYIAIRFTLPMDFSAWAAANAIQIEYKTESALSSDNHVDVYVYKSGNGSVVASSENNVNVNFSNIGISGSSLGSWSANDIIEIYVKLESRNNNFSRIGKICFNYTS